MTTPPLVAVTGATGHLGGRVARLLAEAELPLRLLVRDPDRAPRLADSTVHVAPYNDRDAVHSALAGASVLFLVSGHEATDRVAQHRAVIDAAVDAGVRHVVYTSFMNAAADSTFTLGRDHFHTEAHLRASGLDWTFLRDCLYADLLPALAGPDGVLRGPAGRGRAAFVARADVADAAAAVLRDPDVHAGATYTLTGPEELTLAEAAAILTASTGREVAFVDETLDEAYASRAAYGAEPWQVEAWLSTYLAIAAGELAPATDDVPRLTGHRARTLVDVLRATG